MLELRKISKTYKIKTQEYPALNNINISFREKEFVAILGESGSGKTTLLNILGGLDTYTNGDIIIDGISTKNFKEKNWDNYRSTKIGFVFQEYNLIEHLSILDNVKLSLKITGIKKKERIKRAKEALKKVGLKKHIYKKPSELSGGQRQRVAIARALINDPSILLLDEPTGALDSATSFEILNLIKEISHNKLIIMVTHNEKLAKDYCTRIINIKDGNITSDTSPYLNNKKRDKKPHFKKSKMSFISAIFHSFKNLMTKKLRTTLTIIAASIGIIGIMLTLNLKYGLNDFIDKTEKESYSAVPIQILPFTFNINDNYHGQQKVNNGIGGYEPMAKSSRNDLVKIKDAILNNEINLKDYITEISYIYDFNCEFSTKSNLLDKYINQSLIKDENYHNHFDIIKEIKSENEYQAYIFLNENNRIPNDVLTFLDLPTNKVIAYDEILGKKFMGYAKSHKNNPTFHKEIEITKIVRSKALFSFHLPGICYNDNFKDYLLMYEPNTKLLRIEIYTSNLENKEKVIDIIEKYNKSLDEKNQSKKIHYIDTIKMGVKFADQYTHILSIVLIVFSSISLFVSCIMIGVIIYTSVLERQKEIGIIRAIGGRRKDILRLFLTESTTLGFLSGLFGVLVGILITPILNIILNNHVGVANLAKIDPKSAIMLILISMILTLISGFIPSLIASMKHPVDCIRSQ